MNMAPKKLNSESALHETIRKYSAKYKLNPTELCIDRGNSNKQTP